MDAPDGTAARPTAPSARSVYFDGGVAARVEDLAPRARVVIFMRDQHCHSEVSPELAGAIRRVTSAAAGRLAVTVAAPFGFAPRARSASSLDRADERFVVGRDDDDAAFGHGVAAAILVDVVADAARRAESARRGR